MAQFFDLGGIEVQVNDLLNPVTMNDSGQTEANVAQAVIVADQAGNREDGALVAEDGLRDAHQAGRDRIICSAFAFDDPISGVAGLEENLLHGFGIVRNVLGVAELRQAHACDVGRGPHRHFTVAMLSDDVGVHAARIHGEMLAEKITEARGVKNRS